MDYAVEQVKSQVQVSVVFYQESVSSILLEAVHSYRRNDPDRISVSGFSKLYSVFLLNVYNI